MTDQSRRQFIANVAFAAGAQTQPSAARRSSHRGARSIEIPVRVNHGNAVAPVGAGNDGDDWRPPELVVVSVPFARGVIVEGTPLTAYDAGDSPLPTEQTTLAKWPDGSLRWVQLRVESHADIGKWLTMPWDFQIRSGSVPPEPKVAVSVHRNGDSLTIDNGRIVVVLDPQVSGFGFAQVQVKGVEKQAAGPQNLDILHVDGRRFDTAGVRPTELRVEESGRLRAVITLIGRLQDVYEWRTRLIIVGGELAVRAEHTIGGLGDEEVDSVKRISIRYSTSIGEEFQFRAGGSVIEFDDSVRAGEAAILRQWAPSFAPPRDFSYELAVEGSGSPRIVARGGRSAGWLRCEGGTLTAGIAVRDFAAKGPKAIRVTAGGAMVLDLWPQGETLNLSRARAITHEVLYRFYPTQVNADRGKLYDEYAFVIEQDMHYRAYLRPIVPVVNPEYMCGTQAFGPYVSSASSKVPELEKVLVENFENWHRRHFDRWASYGMLHYGDYIAPFGGDNGGNPDRPHWRDNEWEFASALFTHFIRRGDERAFQFAKAAYQHYMDVDVHFTRPINFYHGYGDSGEMHENYYGPELGHTVVSGLVDAYLLTGDRQALMTAVRLADNLAAVFERGDDAIENMFQHSLRDPAWVMLAMLRVYDITGERKYLDATDKGLDLMNRRPELWKRTGSWTNALLSAALENHHRLTGDSLSRKLYLDGVNWLLNSYHIPERNTLGQRPGGPAFHYGAQNSSSGGSLMTLASSFGYAYELTQDRHWLAVAIRLLHEGMKTPEEVAPTAQFPSMRRSYQTGVTRSDGKWFSILNYYTNRLPTAFRDLSLVDIHKMGGGE